MSESLVQYVVPGLLLLAVPVVLVGLVMGVVADRRRREQLLVWSACPGSRSVAATAAR